MNKYKYVGPVFIFGKCVNEQWSGETYAVSADKAKCNLMYQYKRAHNRCVNQKVTMPGKIVLVD